MPKRMPPKAMRVIPISSTKGSSVTSEMSGMLKSFLVWLSRSETSVPSRNGVTKGVKNLSRMPPARMARETIWKNKNKKEREGK